ncbi:hypothetical protein GBA52_006701 [Prunus armeniaca]|nr:hypothetical protein GBA52_006474 [Prunus armeniaca]KAH0979524.1 hypothetical protein GBA52_006701 [Prunus armeniaca]
MASESDAEGGGHSDLSNLWTFVVLKPPSKQRNTVKNFLSVSYMGPRILGSSSVNLCKTTPEFLFWSLYLSWVYIHFYHKQVSVSARLFIVAVKVDDDARNLLEQMGSSNPGSKAIGIVSDYHKYMSNG